MKMIFLLIIVIPAIANLLKGCQASLSEAAFSSGFYAQNGNDGKITSQVASDMAHSTSQLTYPYSWWKAKCTNQKQYKTIFFSARESCCPRTPYNIYIGDNDSNPQDNTLFTTIEIGSGWYMSSSSTKQLQGKNLYIVSVSDEFTINFFEIQGWGKFAIQQNNYKVELSSTYSSSNKDNAMKLQNFKVETGDYLTGSTTEVDDEGPSYTVTLKAETEIAWVVPIIGGLTQTQNLKIILFDHNNAQTQCGGIKVNPNQDPDNQFNCNKPAIKIQVKTTSPIASYPRLSLASLGILSQCDCTTTSFDPTLMQSDYQLFLGQTTFTISTSNQLQTASLFIYDTISLVCGDGQGRNYCGQRTVQFFDTNTNSNMASLITFNEATEQINVQPTIPTDYYQRSIKLLVRLQTYTSITFTPANQIQIKVACLVSTDLITITSSGQTTQSMPLIQATSGSQIIDEFTLTSSQNSCSAQDIQYTALTTGNSGQDTLFITFVSSTRTITWTQPTQGGIYTTQITGVINNAQLHNSMTTFVLSVITCQQSTITITITSSATTAVNIPLLAPTAGTQVVAEFSEDSVYCQQSDISYKATTTADYSQSTAFITFTPATRTFTWSAPTVSGVYTTTVTGQITYAGTASTVATATTTFVLSVITCLQSTDTITITQTATTTVNIPLIAPTAGTQVVGEFTENSVYCQQSDIVYTAVTTADNSQSTAFITFTPATRTISWTVPTEVGVYTTTVNGQIINLGSANDVSTTFILAVQSCRTSQNQITITQSAVSKINIPLQPQTSGSKIIDEFTQDSMFCLNADIEYSIVVQADKGQDINFITFNEQQRIISWSIPNQDGVYTVNITGTIINAVGTFTSHTDFILTVIYNIGPTLQYFYSQNVTKLTFKSEELTNKFLDLGPIQYENPNKGLVLTKITILPSVNFISYEESSCRLLFDFTNAIPGQKIVVTIFLYDSNSYVCNNTYDITFFIPQNQVAINNNIVNATTKTSQKVEKNATQTETNQIKNDQSDQSQSKAYIQPPQWQIMTTSNQGLLTIYFTEKLLVPDQIKSINFTVIDVLFIQAGTVDIQYLNYTWEVTEYTNTYFKIQLHFQHPLYVSSQGKLLRDQIKVKVIKPSYFMSSKSFKSISQDSQLTQYLPVQLSENGKANAALKSMTLTMNSVSKVMTVGTLFINLAMASSLTYLWGLLNSIQIISYLPFFNTMVPANVDSIYQFIYDLQNFKFFPFTLDSMMDLLGIQGGQNDESEGQKERLLQDTPVKKNSFIRSLGTLIIAFVSGLVLMLVLILLRYAKCCKSRQNKIYKMQQNLKIFLFWNGILRYIIQAYFKMTISSIQYFYVTPRSELLISQNAYETVFALMTLTVIICTPFTSTIYLRSNFDQFRVTEFRNKFRSIIGRWNWRKKSSTNFLCIFCYRRLVQVLLIILASSRPYMQVMMITQTCVIIIIVFGYSGVFFIPLDRRLEYFNEAIILCCVYHYYLFTDFVPDPAVRYTMGYSLIAFTLLGVVVNLAVMFHGTVQKFIYLFRSYKQKWRFYVHKQQMANKRLSIIQSQQVLQQEQLSLHISDSSFINLNRLERFVVQEDVKIKQQQEQYKLQTTPLRQINEESSDQDSVQESKIQDLQKQSDFSFRSQGLVTQEQKPNVVTQQQRQHSDYINKVSQPTQNPIQHTYKVQSQFIPIYKDKEQQSQDIKKIVNKGSKVIKLTPETLQSKLINRISVQNQQQKTTNIKRAKIASNSQLFHSNLAKMQEQLQNRQLNQRMQSNVYQSSIQPIQLKKPAQTTNQLVDLTQQQSKTNPYIDYVNNAQPSKLSNGRPPKINIWTGLPIQTESKPSFTMFKPNKGIVMKTQITPSKEQEKDDYIWLD